jgi:F-type H+-transporting ATPase subunit delta
LKTQNNNFDSNKLFGLLEKSGETLKLAEELFFFKKILMTSPSLKEFLFSYSFSAEAKKELLRNFLGDENFSGLFFQLFDQLIDMKKEKIIVPILEKFLSLVEDKKDLLFCEVLSAVKIKDNDLQDLSNVISQRTKRQAVLINFLNPELLGGFLVKFAGKTIDYTLKNYLEELHDQLNN